MWMCSYVEGGVEMARGCGGSGERDSEMAGREWSGTGSVAVDLVGNGLVGVAWGFRLWKSSFVVVVAGMEDSSGARSPGVEVRSFAAAYGE